MKYKKKSKKKYLSNPKILVLVLLLGVCMSQTYNAGNFWYLAFDGVIFVTIIIVSTKLHIWGKKQYKNEHGSDILKQEIIRDTLTLITILAIKLLFMEYI